MANPSAKKQNRACFLDRDGVVNVEVDYLFEPEKTVLEPSIVPALRAIHKAGFLAVVVTNQSGVARKMYQESDIANVHGKLQELLAPYGEKIDAFYYCPHHPDITGECDCRKPKGGMLLRAAKELNIDLASSLMIGDRISDVKAGINAGCAASYLVLTGYGKNVVAKEDVSQYPVKNDAEEAFTDFLHRFGGNPAGK